MNVSKTIPFLVLSVAALLCYGHTWQYPFHFDDYLYILENGAIHHLGDLRTIFGYNPSRFVTFLSLAMNYALHGESVLGYHVVNVAIHLGTGMLVYVLVIFLPKGNEKHSRFLALFTSLIFLCHPLQTQAVTYIWQRSASLAAFFYLAAVVCYLKSALSWHEGRNRKKSLFYFGLCMVATVLAMFTKQYAFTLPFAFLLLEKGFFATGERSKARTPWVIFSLLTLPILPIATFLFQDKELQIIQALGEKRLLLHEYLLTQVHVFATYLRLLVCPIGQSLDYDFPVTRSLDLKTFSLFLLPCSLLALGLWMYRRSRLFSFGILFFFLVLSVESVIPLEDVIMEHRLYLAIFGFALALGVGVSWGMNRLGWNPHVALLLVVPFILLTYQRNKVWRSEEALWQDVIRKAPKKSRGYNNLGVFYMRQKDSARALDFFRRASEVNPQDAKAYGNQGIVYLQEANVLEAKRSLEKALVLDPMDGQSQYNLGGVYLQLGDTKRAQYHFQWAAQLGYAVKD